MDGRAQRLRVTMTVIWAVVAWLGLASVALGQSSAPPPKPTVNPESVEVFLTHFSYGSADNSYLVQLSIQNPGRVDEIEPRLWDLQTGENTLFGKQLIPVDGEVLEFSLPAEQLKPGHKYKLAIRAKDSSDAFVQRTGGVNGATSEDPLTLASQDFVYAPAQPAPVAVTIDSVNADFGSSTLAIGLHVSDDAALVRYEGLIVDQTGAAVLKIARQDLTSATVVTRLPDSMARSTQPADYHLVLRILTPTNTLVTEQVKDFKLPAAPSPGLFERVAHALGARPVLLWSIAGIFVAACMVYIARATWPRRNPYLRRPADVEPG